MQGDQVEGGLHLDGIWLMGNKELSSKNSAGWSQRPRITEGLVLKVATGKKMEGGRRLGGRGPPGSVPPKHC